MWDMEKYWCNFILIKYYLQIISGYILLPVKNTD